MTVTVVAGGGANGTALLSWTPPLTNVDGSPLNDLAGYRIYHGSSATALNTMIPVTNPGTTSYLVDGLPSGMRFFAVRAIDSANNESPNSNIASKQIP